MPQTRKMAVSHGAAALSSIQPLPRKVPNGGRSASPRAAAVKITPVTGRRLPRPCSQVSFTECSRCKTMPTQRNSAPLTNAWPATYSAVPARPSGVSSANPARNIPAWLIVENASSRLTCRSRKANSAPTTAVEHAEREEQVRDLLPVAERRAEHRPVHPGDSVQAEFDHHAGEQHADRRRRDRVRVGEPEVERHDRALDEQPGDDQQEGDDDEATGVGGGAAEWRLT